jgi:uncharacterized protein (DUF1330 family)
MAVYVVAQSRIENPEMLAEYVSGALPTIMSHGGRVIAFDETPQSIEGEIEHPRTVIVEFESEEAFRGWYDSPEYQEILPKRLNAAPGTLIVATGLG